MRYANDFKRLWFDLVLLVGLLAFLGFDFYEHFPTPIAVICVKALNISIAVIHATITRRLLFQKVDWEGGINAKVLVSCIFYALFIFGYSIGS
jgi:hypothetical protein